MTRTAGTKPTPPKPGARVAGQQGAVAYRKYSTDCVSHETAAKAARRGVWRGVPHKQERKPDRCAHLPRVSGEASYAKTRIDTAKWQRWICSEAEARAVVWRQATR